MIRVWIVFGKVVNPTFGGLLLRPSPDLKDIEWRGGLGSGFRWGGSTTIKGLGPRCVCGHVFDGKGKNSCDLLITNENIKSHFKKFLRLNFIL